MQVKTDTISTQSTIELGNILEAAPVPYTYDTTGWKIVFGLLVLFVIWLAYSYYKWYKKNAYKRAAMAKIRDLEQQFPDNQASLIREIMFALKQTALQTYTRKEVASLKGAAWLNFLDNKGKTTQFTKHQEVITQALYKNELDSASNFNSAQFVASSLKWIKTHA